MENYNSVVTDILLIDSPVGHWENPCTRAYDELFCEPTDDGYRRNLIHVTLMKNKEERIDVVGTVSPDVYDSMLDGDNNLRESFGEICLMAQLDVQDLLFKEDCWYPGYFLNFYLTAPFLSTEYGKKLSDMFSESYMNNSWKEKHSSPHITFNLCEDGHYEAEVEEKKPLGFWLKAQSRVDLERQLELIEGGLVDD